MTKEEKIPNTIEEAIAILDEELSQEDKDFLLEKGPIAVHHTLGRWIRNTWGLWTDSVLKNVLTEQGFTHPDDMSNHIIEEYVKHLKCNIKN